VLLVTRVNGGRRLALHASAIMDDSSATEPVSQVYTGVWTNWSRGKVNGSTITLTRNDANLLIAFLAFFIAWGESQSPFINRWCAVR